MSQQFFMEVQTRGRGFYEITDSLKTQLSGSSHNGLCHIFIKHTSASVIITENADPQVLTDLENFIQRQVPDGDRMFRHTMEGPDDMPAHVRNALTDTSLTVPITEGRLQLGTWQGLFVWEHRHKGHNRQIVVSLV